MTRVGVNQINRGDAIEWNDGVYVCAGYEHVKPGKGPAYVQMKLKDAVSGRVIDHRFRSAEDVEKVDYDRVDASYSYKSGESFVFMRTDNYEEIEIHEDVIGDRALYLVEGVDLVLCMVKGKVLNIEMPKTVVLEVMETEPGIKNASATNVGKPATLSTGIEVTVPPFINEGEKIRIDTDRGEYIERVND